MSAINAELKVARDAKAIAITFAESGNESGLLALKDHVKMSQMVLWEAVAFSTMVRSELRLIQANSIAEIFEERGTGAGLKSLAAHYSNNHMNTSDRFKFSDLVEKARASIQIAASVEIASSSPTNA